MEKLGLAQVQRGFAMDRNIKGEIGGGQEGGFRVTICIQLLTFILHISMATY